MTRRRSARTPVVKKVASPKRSRAADTPPASGAPTWNANAFPGAKHAKAKLRGNPLRPQAKSRQKGQP